MRLIAQPLVPQYRLARILTWARLWLAWAVVVLAQFVGGLPDQFERNARAHLDQCANLLVRVIFLSAFARLPACSRRGNRPGPSRRYRGMRALIGSALRRALRGKDARAKLIALAAVVGNAEIHIAKLARRLARCLKAHAFAPAPLFALALAPPAHGALCTDVLRADTS